MQDYLRYNVFLADINNERTAKNALYRDNLASLELLVLVRFSEDYTVVPRDSAWFAFYDGRKLQRMEDTALYQVREPPHVLIKSPSAWGVVHVEASPLGCMLASRSSAKSWTRCY